MEGKQVFYRKCIKHIDSLSHLFKEDLQYVSIAKIDGLFRLFFINKENQDCTHLFVETIHRDISIYDSILKCFIENIPNIYMIDDKGVYIKFVKKSSMERVLNNDTFFALRKNANISINEMSYNLNISPSAIYNAENVYKDISASTLLRYSIFFGVPITDFFTKAYKKTLEDDLLKRLLKNEKITYEQYKNILNS